MFPTGVTFAQNIQPLNPDIIYSALKCCSCRISFDKCLCPEAKQMKAYVDALIESGLSKEEILYKFAKKYSLNNISDKQIKADIEQRLIKEAGGRRPQIALGFVSFDFGQVSRRQGTISRVFKLYNQGNALLLIKNIKTSCPCASVSLKVDKSKSRSFGTAGAPVKWQMEIKPKRVGELELTVDLASPHVKTGKLIRDALVISNDPLYPEINIKIVADVID